MSSSSQRGVSLRLSVTDRCPLRCLYCKPAEGVPLAPRRDVLRFEEMVHVARVLDRHVGLTGVRLTGGDPLERADIVELVRMLAALHPPDLALTTNGQRLAPMAKALKAAGLKRVNVSLDTLRPDTFRAVTRGGALGATLDGIDAARQAGLAPIKLNVTVLRNVNDRDVVDLARYGLQRGCQVRFLELMPIGVAAANHRTWFVPAREVRARLLAAFDLAPLPYETGATSRNVAACDADGLRGVLGFIAPCSEPFCAGCRRLRLTATGRLLGCLARPEGPDLRPLLRGGSHPSRAGGREGPGPGSDDRLVQAVHEALAVKHRGRRFTEQAAMVSVGG